MSESARVRARAAKIVADVAVHGRSLDAALLGDAELTRQERGLLRALCYDSIRWYIRLSALLDVLLSRPGQTLAPEIRALAIVGLCQLLHTDIPEHAAVDETVNAARILGHPRAAGLINAILRRAQREHVTLTAGLDQELAIRTSHPHWFIDALAVDWGVQGDAILSENNERPPFWIRVNRLRSAGAEYRARLEAQGVAIAASLFNDEALLLERAMDVSDLPGFTAGEVSVQDAAAQLAARLAAPARGERVLDACAAPGGKTGHLLELAPELGELVAVDVSRQRLSRVEENLERLELRAQLIAADATDTRSWFDGRLFDRILIDAPCSGTGVIRRHPDIKLLRRAEDIPALAARQSQLLRALWPLLAPGGRLVYASCSVLAAETTDVVREFLAAHSQARDVTAAAVAALGQVMYTAVGLRIATGTGAMDGFYYACVEKINGNAD
ncbi:MAG: 16S rRNA (cytosine(967)-C(5))-methyltransferase RsmB [Steroidobacter sp.]